MDASANRQKGDADAATWLPPNKAYRCAYVARQVTVKTKYDLWVTPPERAAMERVLGSCPDQRLPKDSGAPVLVPVNVTPPTGPSPAGRALERVGVLRELRRGTGRGRGPAAPGRPGYGPHLDGDGDGVACE